MRRRPAARLLVEQIEVCGDAAAAAAYTGILGPLKGRQHNCDIMFRSDSDAIIVYDVSYRCTCHGREHGSFRCGHDWLDEHCIWASASKQTQPPRRRAGARKLNLRPETPTCADAPRCRCALRSSRKLPRSASSVLPPLQPSALSAAAASSSQPPLPSALPPPLPPSAACRQPDNAAAQRSTSASVRGQRAPGAHHTGMNASPAMDAPAGSTCTALGFSLRNSLTLQNSSKCCRSQ